MAASPTVAGRGTRLDLSDYARAEKMLPHFRSGLALRCELTPLWSKDGSSLVYRINTELGEQYVAVDSAYRTTRVAFDHDRLAVALSIASGEDHTAETLKLTAPSFDGAVVTFTVDNTRWQYDDRDGRCQKLGPERGPKLWETISPDGRWVAFLRDHNLWLRETATGSERQLTTSGEPLRPWASHADQWSAHTRRALWGIPTPKPAVLWSADSSTILTHRSDDRGVYRIPYVASSPGNDVNQRPRLRTHAYALPGDDVVPTGEFVFLNVETGEPLHTGVEYEHTFLSPIARRRAWWAEQGSSAVVYFLQHSRDRRTISLLSIDPRTGSSRTVLSESATSRIDVAPTISDAPVVRVLSSRGQVIWYSERDGYGQLYLYDLETGDLIRQLTDGPQNVVRIVHVDEAAGTLNALVSGIDLTHPTRRAICSVDIDSGQLMVVVDGALDHDVKTEPSGNLYIDVASSPVDPPIFTLRRFGSAESLELERGDVSRLREAGWRAPEPFTVLANDGETPIHGLLYYPHNFDPDKKYPIIDHPYPGPQISRVLPSFAQYAEGPQAEALAALGFAVIAVDGRGTPGRGRAFIEPSYGNLGIAGTTEDHVAALRQLAETRSWLDLDRVGVYGLSGGGFAGIRMMANHPDFYKVCVAEAGNHDNRFYHSMWGETYQGPFDEEGYREASNLSVVDRIVGKVFLVHGELDDNVPVYLTLKLVERFIELDKDVELLIVPGADHLFAGTEHYVVRRRWDYLVRELMGAQPPTGYSIAPFPSAPERISVLAF